MLIATEYAWLKYPSTPLSSSLLLGVNALLVIKLFAGQGRPMRQLVRAGILLGVVCAPVAYMIGPPLLSGLDKENQRILP